MFCSLRTLTPREQKVWCSQSPSVSESNTSARSAASGNNSEDASVEAACEESMRNWIGAVVVFLCACVWLVTSADAQSASERMDNLMALYMVRASEPLCGFKMTDEQRSEVLKAARYLEEKLQLSSEKAEELYNKVAQSMEAQKAGGLCEPNGEWGHAFKQTVESFARSGAPGSTPANTMSASATPAPAAPSSTPEAASAGLKPGAAAPSPEGATKLTGLDALKAVLGNTIVGRRNNQDYADYYEPGGRIVALEGGEIEPGSWTLTGDTVCTDFPSEGKACYHIEVFGDTATFLDEDGTGFRGNILKGNPKHL